MGSIPAPLRSTSKADHIGKRVLIVGAGPVGLFLAYRLGKAGIEVVVIEKHNHLSHQPRAAGYYGGATLALKDAGLLDLVAKRGHVGLDLAWRTTVKDDGNGNKVWGDRLAHLPFDQSATEHPERGMPILPQPQFCKLLLEQAQGTGNVTMHFGSELCDIKNGIDLVTATVCDLPTNTKRDITCDFLVGADGGKSATRKILDIPLQGHTWPERLIATDVTLRNPMTNIGDSHFVIDPINYAVIIPLTKPIAGKESLWRYTIAIDPADTRSDEEIESEENIRLLYDKFMVGPRPLQYDLERRTVYRIHQRLASTMSMGRCALVGDAAHLNNPMGAMGASTGLLDADALAEALIMIIYDGAPISILEKYSDERRKVFQMFVDPTTKYNKLRLQCESKDAAKDWFIKSMKDPSPEELINFFAPFVTTWRTNMRDVARQ